MRVFIYSLRCNLAGLPQEFQPRRSMHFVVSNRSPSNFIRISLDTELGFPACLAWLAMLGLGSELLSIIEATLLAFELSEPPQVAPTLSFSLLNIFHTLVGVKVLGSSHCFRVISMFAPEMLSQAELAAEFLDPTVLDGHLQ